MCEPIQRLGDRIERGKRMKAVTALLELADRLRTAQHEDREHGQLVVRELECLVEQVPVLGGAAPGAACEASPAPIGQTLERRPDLRLVIVDDGVSIRRLVAREPKGVQREGVRVGRRPLLLDEATEDPDLDGVAVHTRTLHVRRTR
jgi:hypothetical protein